MAKKNKYEGMAKSKPVKKEIKSDGKYTENSARNKAKAAGCVVGANTVSHPSPGIKTLGVIDFLTNYCGYVYSRS